MTQTNVPPETETRETRRADQLAAGDWIWIGDDMRRVLSAHTHADETLIVAESQDGAPETHWARRDIQLVIVAEDEMEAAKAAARRARFVAGLREFADWMQANPWVPIERDSGYVGGVRVQVDLHGGDMDANAETVARVRTIADRLGVKVQELDDRTDASTEVGGVSYSVIAWHRDDRPDVPADPCAGGCTDPEMHAEGGHDV